MSVGLDRRGPPPTRLAVDPSLRPGPSPGSSQRHRYALDEHERLFDPRRLR